MLRFFAERKAGDYGAVLIGKRRRREGMVWKLGLLKLELWARVEVEARGEARGEADDVELWGNHGWSFI